MSIIDRAIIQISPAWALRRSYAKSCLEMYEAAKPDRLHSAKGNFSSANTTNEWAWDSIRGQARYLEENHDLIDGLLGVLVNNVVGGGISVEPLPLTRDGELHTEFAEELSEGFEEWALLPDSRGELSLGELERLVCRTWVRDGEVFGEQILGNPKGFRHPNGKVPFSIQALEPEFLPISFTKEKRGIFQSIQYNQWGQPEFYYVYPFHPEDVHSPLSQIPLPKNASNIVHLKYVKRLHQSRGVSILASSLKRISGLQNYEESELVAARIAASIALYIKRSSEGIPPGESKDSDSKGRRYFDLAPGSLFDDLETNEDIGIVESKRPNSLLQSFRDAMVKAVCSATGVNFSTVAKTYSGTYSAQRQELVDSYVSYGVLSDAFISSWSRPMYQRYVQMSLLSGRHRAPSNVDIESIASAHFQPPVMPWIDPARESRSNEINTRNGWATDSEIIRSRGKNPAKVKRQRVVEVQENREKGLVCENDNYHKYYAVKNDNTNRAKE